LAQITINDHGGKYICEIDSVHFAAVFVGRTIEDCKDKALRFLKENSYDGTFNFEVKIHGVPESRRAKIV
jgi:hypothetical protein